MKKLRRIIAVLYASLFLFGISFSASACQEMKDIVPKEYGAWDNHYIYRGNGRAKTTGEDYERLVTSVQIGENSYSVADCLDFEIKGDDVYLILCCECDNALQSVFCLVKYNIKEKTQTLLTQDRVVTNEEVEYYYCPDKIDGIYDDSILLRAQGIKKEYYENGFRDFEFVWYTVDFDGQIVSAKTEDFSDYEWISDEYLVGETYNSTRKTTELKYRKGHFSEAVYVCDLLSQNATYEWSYVEKNGMKGLLIEEYPNKEYNTAGRYLESITFYNLETKEKNSCFVRRYAEWIGEKEYLKTFDITTVNFVYLFKKFTAETECNNRIEKVIYSENSIHIEPFFDLTEKKEYSIYYISDDKMVYMKLWSDSFRGCMSFGTAWQYYQYDMNTKKERKISKKKRFALSAEYDETKEIKKGITLGDYIYFLHDEVVGISTLTYKLRRYNTKTETTETLQFWNEYRRASDNEKYGKYCDNLWFAFGDIKSGAYTTRAYGFYEFIIRDY